uniref:Guanine nucleotide-binding protein subunit gamma n=1 Tax=Astyanax mexicanus TaxID=7994 RepID=A0A8B9L3L3_ASTMX
SFQSDVILSLVKFLISFIKQFNSIFLDFCFSNQVSKASADLMRYCSEHAKYDPLLTGIPASENPFKDKKPCIIL